jgi:RNA-dependent RNA polymerase
VLVFPAVGARPHPNECSGGDLDGDLYFVCWDAALLPLPSGRNVTAMDYSPPPPARRASAGPVRMDEICAFFAAYMRSSNLGQIANAHLARAEESSLGANDPDCLKLARLHSTAVDFAKTSVAAELDPKLRATSLPHFMKNNNKPSYHSEKVLGRLTDAVVDERARLRPGGNAAATPPRVTPAAVCSDPQLAVEGYEDCLDFASRTSAAYSHDVVMLMNLYGVRDEAQLLGACPERFNARAYRQKGRAKLAREALGAEVRALRTRYRQLVAREAAQMTREAEEDEEEGVEECKRASGAELDAAATRLAAALYVVVYSPESLPKEYSARLLQQASGSAHTPRLWYWSLPWMASAEALARVKRAAGAARAG